jgi:hypothetical protein
MSIPTSPINYLRTELAILSEDCSIEQGNLCACPFHEITDRSLKERMAWLDELSDETIVNIHTYLKLCRRNHPL